MFSKLLCLFLGHKKYQPNILDNHDLIVLKDSRKSILAKINICSRCKTLYGEFC